MSCGATQDGQVMVERSDRMWSTGEGYGKPLQYFCLEYPMNSMIRLNDRIHFCVKDYLRGLLSYSSKASIHRDHHHPKIIDPKQE